MRKKIGRIPRGYDGTRVTSRQMSHLLPVVLEKIEKRCGQRPGLILAVWPEIIGERLAPMTKAVAFDKGILYVQVNNSTLYGLLVQEGKGPLLEKLQSRFPKLTIRDIVFRMV